MQALEGIALWVAITAYLFVFLFYLSAIIFKKERYAKTAWRLSLWALFSHTFSIAVRWIESGHPPVLWAFEHSLAGSWFVMAAFTLAAWRVKKFRAAVIIVAPVVMMILGNGIMAHNPTLEPLPPPYQSNWLWVHVGFGWVSYGAYHVAAGLGVLYLLKAKAMRLGRAGSSRLYSALPDLDAMDELIFKFIVYGFISHIVMLGSGAIWAYGLWGRYWAWDPIEIWTLVAWLVYGLNIHLRATYGWKGRRGAWLAVASITGIMILFGGIGFTKGVHTPLL